ncbi:MAG: hypothetical protein H6620_05375 [Halobacteriovoraceae bacterium]|nr:hypothetical protein [Halobacteriovoraceae bacterium]
MKLITILFSLVLFCGHSQAKALHLDEIAELLGTQDLTILAQSKWERNWLWTGDPALDGSIKKIKHYLGIACFNRENDVCVNSQFFNIDSFKLIDGEFISQINHSFSYDPSQMKVEAEKIFENIKNSVKFNESGLAGFNLFELLTGLGVSSFPFNTGILGTPLVAVGFLVDALGLPELSVVEFFTTAIRRAKLQSVGKRIEGFINKEKFIGKQGIPLRIDFADILNF